MTRIFTFLSLFTLAFTQLNAQCRNDSVHQFTYDDNDSGSAFTGRVIYTYDHQKYLTGEEILYFDAGKWQANSRLIISNNPDGSRASTIQQGKNAMDQWFNAQQTIFSYKSPKKYSEITYKSWDTTKKTWVNVFTRKYIYGTGGRDSISSVTIWKNNQWENFTESVSSYNGSGQVAEIVTSAWVSGSWVLNSRSLFTYTGNTASEEIVQTYQAGTWAPGTRKLKTLDPSGNPKIILQQNWNSSYWINSARENYLYTPSGCSLSVDYYLNWNANDSSWGIHLKDSFFGIHNTNLHSVAARKALVYPNPAEHELFILAPEEGTFVLADISGRIALEGRIEEGVNMVTIAHLEPGIYILRTKEESSIVMLR
jgi:hypothetical protein